MSQVKEKGQFFVLDRPMDAAMLNDAVQGVGVVGGVFGRIHTHALRHGAATDISHVVIPEGQGYTTNTTRQTLIIARQRPTQVLLNGTRLRRRSTLGMPASSPTIQSRTAIRVAAHAVTSGIFAFEIFSPTVPGCSSKTYPFCEDVSCCHRGANLKSVLPR